MSSNRDVEVSALRLPEKQRLRLADKLLASLPPPPGAWTRNQIVVEASRRDNEIENGNVKPMSEKEFWSGFAQRR
jgi:hypothetical protein